MSDLWSQGAVKSHVQTFHFGTCLQFAVMFCYLFTELIDCVFTDLTEGAKGMTVSEDSEKNEKQRMDLFYSFLKQRSAADVVSTMELLKEAERYPLIEQTFDCQLHKQIIMSQLLLGDL